MAFGLSEFTDLLDKGPRFAKVAEPEGPLDTMSVVAELRGVFPEVNGIVWDLSNRVRVLFRNASGNELASVDNRKALSIVTALELTDTQLVMLSRAIRSRLNASCKAPLILTPH